MKKMKWTPDLLDKVKKLASSKTIQQVADILGIRYRQVYSCREYGIKFFKKKKEKMKLFNKKISYYPVLQFTTFKKKPNKWMKVKDGLCRYPVNDGPCLLVAQGKSPYCKKHHAISFVKIRSELNINPNRYR